MCADWFKDSRELTLCSALSDLPYLADTVAADIRLESMINIILKCTTGEFSLEPIFDCSSIQWKDSHILKANNLQIGYVRHSLAEIQERKKVLKKKIVKQRAAMGGLSAAEKQDVKVKSSMV